MPGIFRRVYITTSPLIIVAVCALLAASGWLTIQIVRAADPSCQGSPVSLPNVEKKLLTTADKDIRPGRCITPTVIFVHATNGQPGETAEGVWGFFNSGTNPEKVNSHFIVDKDGKILQTVELYPQKAEWARTNDPYNEQSIAIEMVGPLEFENKDDVPDAQYEATLNLVAALMKQYNIPIGSHPANWTTCGSARPETLSAGVYGHFQICVDGHSDPGPTMFASFRQDLLAIAPITDSNPETGALGGRWVPYDAYARPYSWPMNGTILQNYGFTPMAQSLGERFPGLYPKGDPGVIFSKDNHTAPPASTNDRYINPNIDISPRNNEPSARAVYATHAGWITYADWAGDQKGYSIQVESDVDGDGQADLATRYMRLQAPQNNEFAPDVEVYTPTESPESLPGPGADELQTPLPPPYVMEGESMNRGPKSDVINDTDASGGKALRVAKNEVARQAYGDSADRLTVRAKADNGIDDKVCSWPGMILRMDGNQAGQRIRVSETNWTEFTVAAPFDGANHTLTIAYEPTGPTCVRELILDKVTFELTNPNALEARTLSEQFIEAESLAERTTTEDKEPVIEENDLASDGKFVHMADNGSISDTVSIKEGNWIKVRARGENCQNGWPKMTVSLGDSVILETAVTDFEWIEYSTALNLPAGSSTEHELTIAFSDDADEEVFGFFSRCSRSLDVDLVTIQNNTASQTPVNQNSLIGKTKYVGFNQLLGYAATARGRTAEGQKEHPDVNLDNVPNANQTYLSYRIMYNNPNFTTFPWPSLEDSFINAKVDNPYIIETENNTVAGNLKVAWDNLNSPMWFFCALRTTGNTVLCAQNRNP